MEWLEPDPVKWNGIMLRIRRAGRIFRAEPVPTSAGNAPGVRAALDAGVEAALRRDRVVILASFLGLAGLSWLYLWREADAMDRMMMGLAPMAMQPTAANAVTLLLAFLMWTIMMVGMMLPSAAPTALFYAAIVRANRARGTALPAAWLFAGGYLVVWTAFSLGATALQVLFEEAQLASSMMVTTSRWLSGAILVAAGIYQWSPLKDRCLAQCHAPVQFIARHWRSGRFGALRMGMTHGLYCVGCCWAIMLLLFVGGVMNLLWVALIAGFVLLEKLLPRGRLVGRIAGLGLIIGGALVLLAAQASAGTIGQ
jgi:predicted metal-binding membrane protein